MTEAAAVEAAKTQEAFAAAQAAWDAEKESDVAAATARAGERATEPISVFVSKKTGRVQVRQAWRTIHDAPATFRDADAPLGTHVYVATEMVEDGKAMRWLPSPCPSPCRAPRRGSAAGATATGAGGSPSPSPPTPASPARPRPARSTASSSPRRPGNSLPTGSGPAPRSSSPSMASAAKRESTRILSCSRGNGPCVLRDKRRRLGYNAAPMRLITTTDELAKLCKRLAQHDFVAVDTEFIREQTYWPRLCLIQLAGPRTRPSSTPSIPASRSSPSSP